jgi:antirestriction protein ArdC
MKTNELREEITNKVIALMEEYGTDWTKPWTLGGGGMPTNVISKKPYSGINIMMLMMSDTGSNEWGTYKQWKDKDAQVKKGEKGTHIIFYKSLKKESVIEGAKDTVIPMMRNYTVFNASQVDGYEVVTPEPKGLGERMDDVDLFLSNTNAVIKSGGSAYYSPKEDKICIPDMGYFFSTNHSSEIECYYSTLLHELTHWTGAKHRLDRDLKNKFGSKDYAREELVAELGATFLGIELGITNEPRPDHAEYLNSWMTVLKEDPSAIFKASTMASKAVAYLHDLQSEIKDVHTAA